MSKPSQDAAADQTANKLGPKRERRHHPRHAAQEQVTLRWQGKLGNTEESPAMLRNVSAGGFAVEVNQKFAVGSFVEVHSRGRSLPCMVRHVQPQGATCVAGLEVLTSSDGASSAQSLRELSSALAKREAD